MTMAKAYVDGGPEAGNKMMGEFDGASEKLQKALAPFVDSQIQGMKKDLGQTIEHAELISRNALMINLLAMLVAAVVAYAVIRSITQPLSRALSVARSGFGKYQYQDRGRQQRDWPIARTAGDHAEYASTVRSSAAGVGRATCSGHARSPHAYRAARGFVPKHG